MGILIPQAVAEAQNQSRRQLYDFSAKAFDSVEQLVALNLQVVKTTLAENQAMPHKALLSPPGELFALSATSLRHLV
jgi:hypothetical protein